MVPIVIDMLTEEAKAMGANEPFDLTLTTKTMARISIDCVPKRTMLVNVFVANDRELGVYRLAADGKVVEATIEVKHRQEMIETYDEYENECLDKFHHQMALDRKYHVMTIDQHFDYNVDNRQQSSEMVRKLFELISVLNLDYHIHVDLGRQDRKNRNRTSMKRISDWFSMGNTWIDVVLEFFEIYHRMTVDTG